MIKAGLTKHDCGTKIRITKSNDKDLIGVTGTLTHPFQGLMGSNTKYIAGLRLDQEGIFSGDICNLTTADKFEVIEGSF